MHVATHVCTTFKYTKLLNTTHLYNYSNGIKGITYWDKIFSLGLINIISIIMYTYPWNRVDLFPNFLYIMPCHHIPQKRASNISISTQLIHLQNITYRIYHL